MVPSRPPLLRVVFRVVTLGGRLRVGCIRSIAENGLLRVGLLRVSGSVAEGGLVKVDW